MATDPSEGLYDPRAEQARRLGEIHDAVIDDPTGIDVTDQLADAPVLIGDVESTTDEVTFTFPAPTKPRVAICGFATGHAHLAPNDDPDTECWGINRLWKVLPDRQWDRWFELHDLDKFYRGDQEHRNFLKAFEGPVYVRAQDYALAREWGIEGAQPFPHELILERFWPYFNNTVSWLVALAILMTQNDRQLDRPGFEWMGFFGVDMAQDHLLQAEYSQQRPSCEYYIGMATAIGIEIHIPHGSDLLKTSHLYGYEDSGPFMEKLGSRFTELGRMKEQVRAELGQLEARREALVGQMSQFDGAMQEDTYIRKNWVTLPPTPDPIE